MTASMDELRQRRAKLQLRLQRQEYSRQFRALAPRLCAVGLRRFSRLPPVRAQALLAPFAQWPARDERFDWSGIRAHDNARWRSDEGRLEIFRHALRACFPGRARLAFVLHTHESGLVLGRDDAFVHAETVLADLYSTVWVVDARAPAALVELSFVDQEARWLAAGR